MTFGSLFAGIGGFDLGLERAGMECRWQVEIDEFCLRVLEKHWPDVPRCKDVRECGRHNLEAVDLICGGFPCQPVSLAGKRQGQSDPRWLWPEFARVVAELRPRWVLVENVPGLLSTGLGDILVDLAALGYDAEWDCIPAAAVGAPHRRDRVWIVAYTNNAKTSRRREDGGKIFAESEPVRPCSSSSEVAHTPRLQQGRQEQRAERERAGLGCEPSGEMADADIFGRGEGFHLSCGEPDTGGQGAGDKAAYFSQWATEPDVGRVAHGIPARVDRLRGLGNAVVPQVVEWIGRRIIAASEQVAGASAGREERAERSTLPKGTRMTNRPILMRASGAVCFPARRTATATSERASTNHKE